MNNLLKMNLDERREMIIHGDTVKTILFLTIPTFMMAIVQVLIPFSDGLFLNKILGDRCRSRSFICTTSV